MNLDVSRRISTLLPMIISQLSPTTPAPGTTDQGRAGHLEGCLDRPALAFATDEALPERGSMRFTRRVGIRPSTTDARWGHSVFATWGATTIGWPLRLPLALSPESRLWNRLSPLRASRRHWIYLEVNGPSSLQTSRH